MQLALSKRARRRLLCLVVLVVLGGILLAGAYGATAQPRCAGCHDDRAFVSATLASPHAKVECASCHLKTGTAARLGFGAQHLADLIPVGAAADRDRAAVPDSRCLKCHAAVERGVVRSNGIRIDHAKCTVDRSCSDCHSAVAHGSATSWASTYDMETCLACHASKASTACDSCHEGRTRSDRVSSGVFATTHGPQWRTTHGMGNAATCSACHTAASCGTCHGPGLPHDAEFLGRHAEVSKSPAARCSSCHERSFCSDCHGLEMPHSKQFTRTHAVPAKTDPGLCQRCHAGPDCTTCHTKHIHPGGAVGSEAAASSAVKR